MFVIMDGACLRSSLPVLALAVALSMTLVQIGFSENLSAVGTAPAVSMKCKAAAVLLGCVGGQPGRV